MNKLRLLTVILVVDGILLLVFVLTAMVVSAQANVASIPPTVSGVVVDEKGLVEGAIVQIQGTLIQTQTDAHGAFTISGLGSTAPVVLSAWVAGHHVGWTTLDPSAPDWNGGTNIIINLKTLAQKDNSQYTWFTQDGLRGSQACSLCHREYSEWKADAHSHSATNVRFLTLYTGEDVSGQPGQITQYGLTGALPPNPNKPYYGPGFRLDNPSRAGNCATCHTPLVSTTPNNKNCAWSGCHTDITIEHSNGVIGAPAIPTSAHGVSADGISCEFCHKVGAVKIDPKTGLPPPDMPGILSMRLYRPMTDADQVFFGTVLDVNVPDSYLPLLSQSQFCSSCHYGVFGGVVGMNDVKGGTVIYNSYGEWLDSPYSKPQTGASCQDCHMPVSDANWFVLAKQGGHTRDYVLMRDHTMPGASDKNLLENAVTMNTTAQRNGDQVKVEVSITNDQTGHDVPTDAPMRSVILVVEALGADGQPLALSDGSVNPDYDGDLAGLPGKTFAKILRDDWTGETPTSAFWRPVTLVSDNRLVAMTTDTSNYTFTAPAGTAVTVNVRLLYRRAFYQLEKQKGWNDPDILMEHATLQVPAN